MLVTPQAATPADYAELAAIWTRSVQATHHFLSPADRDDIQRHLPEYFGQVDLYKWQVAGQTVGFSGTAGTELVMLFLDPPYFRHGYGQAIFHALMRKPGIQTVSVNEQNPGALAFYQRQGFQIVSRAAVDEAGRPYPILNLERQA